MKLKIYFATKLNPDLKENVNFVTFSLALHPEKILVATGQIGKDPYICVWDTLSVKAVSFLKNGHSQGVGAVNFDKEGNVSLYCRLYVRTLKTMYQFK